MGEFFLNDETYENDNDNNTFFYIILEYDMSQLRSFLTQRPKYLACLARNSLSESIEIVKSSKFNDFNCHLLPITMTLSFF